MAWIDYNNGTGVLRKKHSRIEYLFVFVKSVRSIVAIERNSNDDSIIY